jgi:hypothetical protein
VCINTAAEQLRDEGSTPVTEAKLAVTGAPGRGQDVLSGRLALSTVNGFARLAQRLYPTDQHFCRLVESASTCSLKLD